MKKIVVITALMLLASTAAFAGTTVKMDLTDKANTGLTLTGAENSTASYQLIGKTSTGVGLAMITDPQGYSLATQHMNGTKEFGSSYDSTSIYATDVATVGTPVVATLTATDTTNFDGWKPL